MCGRFSLCVELADLALRFNLAHLPKLPARFNIAPQQPVAVVRPRTDEPKNELVMMRWGLVPGWAKDPTIGSRMINARCETAAQKPAYRQAMRYRRGLIPATGFYEWQKQPGGKQPWYLGLADGAVFAFAALWESWRDEQGEELQTCTILTTEPNELCKPIHDRMPVILAPDAYDRWLDPANEDPATLTDLLRPFDASLMRAHPVSARVNTPKHDDESLILPIDQPGEDLFGDVAKW